jgi:hypothetical protein
MTARSPTADACSPSPACRTSRRSVARWAAAALAGAAVGRPLRLAAADAPPPGEWVDIHTHLGQTWNTSAPLTAGELLRWMDAHQVAQAVVLPLVSPEASSYLTTSESVLEQTRPHRDRLIPFCAIDPRTSYQGGRKGLVGMLARYVEAGARGFGEHKPGLKIDDPLNLELLAACSELKLPVLVHLDNQRNLDAPGLPGLARALQAAPQAPLIGHGPGWWASISGQVTQADLGGYPRGPVAPGGAIDTLMDRFPNLYGDLSAGSGAGALRRDRTFARELLIRRADRMLFGSDFLSPGQEVPQFEELAALQLPADVAERIYRGNARRLLGWK